MLHDVPSFVSEYIPMEISDAEFAQISLILSEMRGFNLEAYKDKCVRRRIAIRIRANHCFTVREYCELLSSQEKEVEHLLKVLTIHVSQFFRNFSVFEKLRLEVFPYLFSAARQEGLSHLRFWSVGCAGGEEPYTLAMILDDLFQSEMAHIPVQIDATDVDSTILESARVGLYSQERMQELPFHYRQKYFTEENGLFLLSPKIRNMVNFSNADMFHDETYQQSDLILCRNVMIYFAREQQEKVFRNIARVLNRWGFLMLGKSETILGESRGYFKTVCPIERLFCPVKEFER